MVNVVDNWPYTNLHNLNEDWILDEIKRLGIKVENTEKFMPHVAEWNNGQWDVNHEYTMNEIVFNGNEIYIAIKNVPSGVNINDVIYWALVGTDSYINTKVDKAGDIMTGPLQLPTVSVINDNVAACNFGNTNGVLAGILVVPENTYKGLVFRQVYAPDNPNVNDYVLPPADGVNAAYSILTSKYNVPWVATTSWQKAVTNAKMDIVIGYDAVLGGVNVRFTIMIPIFEIDNTLRYHFSSTAITSAGESYIMVGVDAGSIQVMQLVTQGVPTAISSAFLFYR